MSAPDEPTSKKRELSMEELDSIVGGGAPAVIHSALNTMVTMETGHNFDAVALAHVAAPTVQTGHTPATQTSHAIELVNTVEHSNAADAHLAFVHASSPNNSAVFINGTTFISDIQKEVSAHKITGDQAVTQLAGFAHEFPRAFSGFTESGGDSQARGFVNPRC